MKIYYDKKLALSNSIWMFALSGAALAASALCAVFLREYFALWLSFLLPGAAFAFVGAGCVRKYKTPYALELTEEGIAPYKGGAIASDDIQCVTFSAELTKKNTGEISPNPAVYAAAPLPDGLSGAACVVTLTKKYVFVGLYDICKGYEAACKLLPDCQFTLTAQGQPPALYIYDRYKDKLKQRETK